MRFSHAQLLAINTITNYLRFVVIIAVMLVITPLMLRSLGTDAYGLWALIFSVLGIFQLADFGFGTATLKFIAEAIGAKSYDRLPKIVSTMAYVYLALAGLALIALIILTPFFNRLFSIPPTLQNVALIVLWILAFRLVILELPLTLFQNLLYARQQIYLINAIQAVTIVLYGLAAWYGLTHGIGLIGLSLISLASMLFEYGAYTIAAAMGGGLHLRAGAATWGFFREATSLSTYTFLTSVAGFVLLKTDPIIIKLFLPLSAVTLYALALRISEYTLTIIKQFANALSPLVAYAGGEGNEEKLRTILLTGTRYSLIPAGILCTGFFVFGELAIVLWVGEAFRASGAILLVLNAAVLALTPQLTAAVVLTLTGEHRFTGRMSLYSMVINIGLSVVLILLLGVIGCALGTLIATVIIDIGLIIPYALRKHGVAGMQYIRTVVPSLVVPALADALISVALLRYVTPTGLLGLLLISLPGVFVYLAIIWLVFIRKEEKTMIRSKLFPARG